MCNMGESNIHFTLPSKRKGSCLVAWLKFMAILTSLDPHSGSVCQISGFTSEIKRLWTHTIPAGSKKSLGRFYQHQNFNRLKGLFSSVCSQPKEKIFLYSSRMAGKNDFMSEYSPRLRSDFIKVKILFLRRCLMCFLFWLCSQNITNTVILCPYSLSLRQCRP